MTLCVSDTLLSAAPLIPVRLAGDGCVSEACCPAAVPLELRVSLAGVEKVGVEILWVETKPDMRAWRGVEEEEGRWVAGGPTEGCRKAWKGFRGADLHMQHCKFTLSQHTHAQENF